MRADLTKREAQEMTQIKQRCCKAGGQGQDCNDCVLEVQTIEIFRLWQDTWGIPGGLLSLRARMVNVMAMPVATGTTETVPKSPKPASLSASLVSRFVNLARSEEPAACRAPSDTAPMMSHDIHPLSAVLLGCCADEVKGSSIG